MLSLVQQAEVRRQELSLGLISVSEVVQWADAMLAEMVEYDDDLVNVSLAGDFCPQDVVGLLRRLTVGADEFEAMRSVLGTLHGFLLKDDSQARAFTNALEGFWIDHGFELPEDLRFIAGLDDDFGLAEDGIYGTRDETLARLIDNLAVFDLTANKSLDGAD